MKLPHKSVVLTLTHVKSPLRKTAIIVGTGTIRAHKQQVKFTN